MMESCEIGSRDTTMVINILTQETSKAETVDDCIGFATPTVTEYEEEEGQTCLLSSLETVSSS